MKDSHLAPAVRVTLLALRLWTKALTEERKATQIRIPKLGKNQQATFFQVTILAGNEEGGDRCVKRRRRAAGGTSELLTAA